MNKFRLFFGALILSAFAAAHADTISVSPATLNATVGENFSLNVDVSGATDLYGYQFDLGFNSSVLSVTSVVEGSLLPGVSATSFFPGLTDNVGGTISFIADILNGAPAGANGDGTLVTIDFSAIGTGVSSVSIFNVTALNSFGEGITEATDDGSVTVNAGSPMPEPASLLLFGGAMVVLFSMVRGRALRRRPVA